MVVQLLYATYTFGKVFYNWRRNVIPIWLVTILPTGEGVMCGINHLSKVHNKSTEFQCEPINDIAFSNNIIIFYTILFLIGYFYLMFYIFHIDRKLYF
jgi:hypothetical protein